ncbi:hypothetical protein ORM30_20755 [Bacillus cereus]|nr:hypothetical protein [Bacillus cereus]
MTEKSQEKTQETKPEITSKEKHCGIIMPIAAMDGYSAEHWLDVKNIIIEATKNVEGLKFKTEIVSNSDGEIDIIHKRIIQNLYNADIVVCDISGRNPNVMFELGMRLTFDKPTVIIKDTATDFIFDTGSIEHLQYPKDLRFKQIVAFQKELARRIKSTYEKSQIDPNYSTFLGNFGKYKVPSLNQETISDVNQYILEELTNLRKEVGIVRKEFTTSANTIVHKQSDSGITTQTYGSTSPGFKNACQRYIKLTRDNRPAHEIAVDEKFQNFIFEETGEKISNLSLAVVAINKAQVRIEKVNSYI